MPQSLAAPETTQSSDERKATDTDTPAVQVNLIEHKGLHLNKVSVNSFTSKND